MLDLPLKYFLKKGKGLSLWHLEYRILRLELNLRGFLCFLWFLSCIDETRYNLGRICCDQRERREVCWSTKQRLGHLLSLRFEFIQARLKLLISRQFKETLGLYLLAILILTQWNLFKQLRWWFLSKWNLLNKGLTRFVYFQALPTRQPWCTEHRAENSIWCLR